MVTFELSYRQSASEPRDNYPVFMSDLDRFWSPQTSSSHSGGQIMRCCHEIKYDYLAPLIVSQRCH